MQIKTIVVERNDREFQLGESLRKLDLIKLLGSYENGDVVLNMLKITQLEVLIVDLLTPGFDPIRFFENLRKMENNYVQPRRIIVISEFVSNYVNTLLNGFNIDYIMLLERARGVEIEIIPRLEQDGRAVSATEVRRLLAAGQVDEACALLPRTTADYIRENIEDVEKWLKK